MAIKVNGTTITDVKVNGISVKTVKVGSTTVFQAMAKMWKQTSNTNYTTELELYSNTEYNNAYQGCATPSYLLSQLNLRRPATSETVGTIIRVRNNLDFSVVGGGINYCPTYMYYEAVIEEEKEWVYITYYSSDPNIQNSVYVTGNFDSITEMITYLESNYPASNYDIGKNAIVYNSNGNTWNVFEVQNV